MLYGSKIKKLRELRNFTQSYLASKLNITQSAYSRYESDDIAFSPEMLNTLSVVLGISLDAINYFDETKLFDYIEMMHQCNSVHFPKEIELYTAMIQTLTAERQYLELQISQERRNLQIQISEERQLACL